MNIDYVHGDIFTTNCEYLIHGCNSRGLMGAGVAKMIKQKYPKAYQDYLDIYNNNGLILGDFYSSEQPDGKIIINAITQKDVGTDKIQVSYWAIANIFRNLNNLGMKKVALPKIGSGLAGGDWKVISAIIENESKNYQPIVYVI
jgi:O-acetyl-ADP-ribose deacetylase (regulator of RNase III)